MYRKLAPLVALLAFSFACEVNDDDDWDYVPSDADADTESDTCRRGCGLEVVVVDGRVEVDDGTSAVTYQVSDLSLTSNTYVNTFDGELRVDLRTVAASQDVLNLQLPLSGLLADEGGFASSLPGSYFGLSLCELETVFVSVAKTQSEGEHIDSYEYSEDYFRDYTVSANGDVAFTEYPSLCDSFRYAFSLRLQLLAGSCCD